MWVADSGHPRLQPRSPIPGRNSQGSVVVKFSQKVLMTLGATR